jgi:hypothetical protein
MMRPKPLIQIIRPARKRTELGARYRTAIQIHVFLVEIYFRTAVSYIRIVHQTDLTSITENVNANSEFHSSYVSPLE